MGADGELRPDGPSAARRGLSAADRGLSRRQGVAAVLILGTLVSGAILTPAATVLALVVLTQSLFVLAAIWRTILLVASRRASPVPPAPGGWPRYTVLAALHDEAEMAPQLIARLAAIDYPKNRLQGLLLLEADDAATIAAVANTPKPRWLKAVVVPPGEPRTKPRALNYGLARATGELLTVYDAEDEPDPRQLHEAAARLIADPRLGCLQAPLRIRVRRGAGWTFLSRQFAAEYAALFEVILPGMARLGLPFPLGGTSNHVRVTALRAAGGWDAHNVTEDADLGFTLWRAGWGLDVIGRPTWETAPEDLGAWLPQRTRWLKGYMQTLGVHTREPHALGWRGLLALASTLGLSVTAALAHAPSIAWLASAVLLAAAARVPPATPPAALAVFAVGAASAWTVAAIGSRRAGVRFGPIEAALTPSYWSLLSLAFVHALVRLATEPFAWDKTPHRPDGPSTTGGRPGR